MRVRWSTISGRSEISTRLGIRLCRRQAVTARPAAGSAPPQVAMELTSLGGIPIHPLVERLRTYAHVRGFRKIQTQAGTDDFGRPLLRQPRKRVSAGDLLIELDSTAPKADAERLRNELLAASFASARAGAMLHVLGTGDEPVMPQVSLEVDRERVGTEAQVLAGEYGEFAGRLAGLRAEIQRRRAERNTMLALVHKLEQTVLLARKRAEDYGMLVEKNYVARHAWSEIEQVRIEQEQDLVAQRARIVEIDAAIAESLQTRDTFLAEARKALLDRRQDADRQVAAIGQELRKAVQRDTQTRLVAPVSGVVQQLAAHTVGGVVTPAQPLMVVVPEAAILEVEAFLPNKDIGFVLPGQEARIKLETFPFTRYGTIDGVVFQVSGDAIQDERMGLVYSTRVRLLKNRLQVGEREVSLSPGMATIVEIRTGGQRVIEYLLGPLLRYKDESLRER